MDKKEAKKQFGRICRGIKSLRIQGAESVAIAGLKAYSLIPEHQSIHKLISLRPTEPALKNALEYAYKHSVKQALQHFLDSEKVTNKLVLKLIKNNSKIFTHCHSSSVVDSLVYAKKQGKKFSVLNTETRPLFQGRKTAIELAKAGINVTTMVDAAARIEIAKSDIVMLGCDAVLDDGSVINKIGSCMFAEIAHLAKKPVYIVTDSWKFSCGDVRMEERNFSEIWKKVIGNVSIRNPAFERIDEEFITAIVSELGILKPKVFAGKIKKLICACRI